MRRRELITFIGSAAIVWPLAARAQQAERMRRVGVLMIFAPTDPEAQVRVRAFGQGLQDLGWWDGHNVQIEYRFAAGDFERMRTFAKELVDLQPDVIVAHANAILATIQQHTRAIPVVFVMVTDLVGTGQQKSLSHPDSNITGFTTFDYSIVGKWVELLKQIAPHVTRVGLMFNPDAALAGGSLWLRPFETAASSFAVQPIALPVHDIAEMQGAMAALGREPGGGLIVTTDTFTSGHHAQIVALAAQHRLPGCYAFRYFATEGGLMSYGPNGADVFRRSASYIDRILKGAKPADLPIQLPTKFDLVINLKTAKALGLTVPLWLRVRADEVIE